MTNRRTALLALAVAGAVPAILTARAAFAQTAPVAGGDQADYVMQTLTVGTVALKTSEIAADKATDPMVKEFAGLEVGEQQAVASVLAATEAGKTPPALPPDRQKMIDDLAAMEPGPDFDAAYIDGQVKGHQELLAIQQTLSGSNEATIEAITARLAEQAVTSHLAMLNHIKESLGAGGTQPATPDQPAAPTSTATPTATETPTTTATPTTTTTQ